MKFIALKGSVLVVSLAASTVLAQTGTVAIWDGPYSYGIGSEWTALANPSLVGGYAPAATQIVNGQTGFDTFCLQTGISVDPGSYSYPAVTYNYNISLSSIGSADAYALTEGTAWLYSQFAQGKLAGYDYANSGAGTTPGSTASRQIDAGALQAAFWYLQGGQSWSGYSFGGAGDIYYDDALADLGSVAAMEAPVTASTDFGVEVMNLTDSMGNPAQNQLVYLGTAPGQSVSESGATFSLLGASVMVLAMISRGLRQLTV